MDIDTLVSKLEDSPYVVKVKKTVASTKTGRYGVYFNISGTTMYNRSALYFNEDEETIRQGLIRFGSQDVPTDEMHAILSEHNPLSARAAMVDMGDRGEEKPHYRIPPRGREHEDIMRDLEIDPEILFEFILDCVQDLNVSKNISVRNGIKSQENVVYK